MTDTPKYWCPANVLTVCQTLRDKGYEAWIVGGAVRDMMLHRPIHDWDIATDAHPGAVMQLFDKVVPTGIQHGTVTVMLDNIGIEVTTFRGEGFYTDGRRPDTVTFVKDITIDLGRRDFTINAMAWDPINNILCDPFGGQADLLLRIIKTVGDPHYRFDEDALRMVRAARFAATLGFSVIPSAIEAIKLLTDRIVNVSMERIHDEFMKMLSAERPSIAFRILAETGLLDKIIPELKATYNCYDADGLTVWEHTMRTVDACTKRSPTLRFAALLHDIAKPLTQCSAGKCVQFPNHEFVGIRTATLILTRMRCSCTVRQYITRIIQHHSILGAAAWNDAELRRWARSVGTIYVHDVIALARANLHGHIGKTSFDIMILNNLENRLRAMPLETIDIVLAVTGEDVMKIFNIGPGSAVGVVLHGLTERVVEDPTLNNREKLLELLKGLCEGQEEQRVQV